jgi:hypothetical protein
LPAKSNIWFLIVVGFSCVLIGFALSTMAYRDHYLHVPGSGLIERMNLELNLTPAQRDQIGDILRDTRFKVMKARQDFDHQRHNIFWQGLGQVRGVLTPDQQKLFDRDFTHPSDYHGHDDHDGHDGGDHEDAPPPASK